MLGFCSWKEALKTQEPGAFTPPALGTGTQLTGSRGFLHTSSVLSGLTQGRSFCHGLRGPGPWS